MLKSRLVLLNWVSCLCLLARYTIDSQPAKLISSTQSGRAQKEFALTPKPITNGLSLQLEITFLLYLCFKERLLLIHFISAAVALVITALHTVASEDRQLVMIISYQRMYNSLKSTALVH